MKALILARGQAYVFTFACLGQRASLAMDHEFSGQTNIYSGPPHHSGRCAHRSLLGGIVLKSEMRLVCGLAPHSWLW